MSKRITVIGCGWLGLPLAKQLATDGFDVFGTTTSEDKLTALSIDGIQPALLNVNQKTLEVSNEEIWTADTFVVAIPPGVRRHGADFHVRQVEVLLKYIPIEARVVYVSSTSVYPSLSGTYLESFPLDLSNTGNMTLFSSEELMRSRGKSAILRCGGLMGEDRVSGSYFAGKQTSGRKQPVNYIHQRDAVDIICKVVSEGYIGTYNLVCPQHPTRAEVYKANSEKFGFEMPSFKDDGIQRTIDGALISDKFNYEFSYPDPRCFHG